MHALEVTFHVTFLCPTRRLNSPQTISKNTLHKSLITGKLLFKYFDNRMYSSENWNAADSEARRHLTGESIYIHPFDGKEIWNGHATIIDELKGKLIIPWYWMARKIVIFIIRNIKFQMEFINLKRPNEGPKAWTACVLRWRRRTSCGPDSWSRAKRLGWCSE